ncbi:MAG: 50S ribosomal protein L35 [Deltaproteobacteria bacterium]|nr:50S ribosomal protein L35 [Deltaproteobacteria bacterium]
MPKIRSRKSAAKRFSRTKTGRFKRSKANRRHILTKKSPGRMRRLRSGGLVCDADQKQVDRMLPYA